MLNHRTIKYLASEKITFVYIIITSIIIVSLNQGVQSSFELLKYRFLILFVMVGLAYLNSYKNYWIIRFSRVAFLGGLLAFWYPETFDINKVIPNFDFVLANTEQWIFGFQPALVFSNTYSQHWFSEIMNMGYLAYYPLIICTCLYFYIKRPKQFELFFFTLLCSFYMYYFIYIIFPTAGPQYYYSVDGLENVRLGIFQNVGHYFNDNQILFSTQKHSGFFLQLVKNTQMVGERPTAAFPSSHVGITTLIMILVAHNKQYLMFGLLFPIYLALVMATVYIQAHYVIDVIAGFVTAFIFYYFSNFVYKQLVVRQV